MFSFKETLKKAFLQAVGNKADYEIILAAANWIEKGVLIEGDLAEIQEAIDAQYAISEIENTKDVVPNDDVETEVAENDNV